MTKAEFDQLVEPLKHIRVPSCSGEEAFVCDGAIYGFEVVLGSTYKWHIIPPKGGEIVGACYAAASQVALVLDLDEEKDSPIEIDGPEFADPFADTPPAGRACAFATMKKKFKNNPALAKCRKLHQENE